MAREFERGFLWVRSSGPFGLFRYEGRVGRGGDVGLWGCGVGNENEYAVLVYLGGFRILRFGMGLEVWMIGMFYAK